MQESKPLQFLMDPCQPGLLTHSFSLRVEPVRWCNGNMRRTLLAALIACAGLNAQVKLTQSQDRISVTIDGKPFTEFFFGPEAPKPYLHPLRSASGVIVTRRFPMEKLAGETTDHPHHRGLWFTHGDVNGIDFWMNEPGDKRPNVGRVVLNKIVEAKSGDRSGAISAVFDWRGPDGKKLIEESRTMVFHSDPALRMVDFDPTLTALEKVKFGDTKEGTFALRVASGLEAPARNSPANPPRTGKMVDAEGREGESQVWGKRAPWVDVYGEVDGEKLGIAILDHPSNPRFPTFWHCRAYGLCAANIFGMHDFLNDKTQDGSLTLNPGEKLRLRYRVIVHPGDPTSARVADLYKAWAASTR